MSVNVTSEIGRLRAVLVHSPGPELLAVTPDTREDYLYDDIIHLETARREHRQFVAVLERFSEVYHVRDLLTEAVASPEAREMIVREAMDIVASEPLAKELYDLPAEEVVRVLVEGREEEPGPLARTLNERGYTFPPLPNLFFTRDTAMAINQHVMIGSMRYKIRWPEELIMRALFAHHPKLANAGILYDGSSERRLNYTLEGGDVHPLRPDLMMIGFSDRSSPAAIDELASLVFARTEITDLIVVVMPKENAAIHLDMIFTQVDREQCVLHAPHFIGAERLSILHWRKGKQSVDEMPNIFSALTECGLALDPIICGGDRRIMQEREQWASGCNFFALRPGLVMAYDRNEATLAEMEKGGYRIVSAAALLAGSDRVSESDRAVITVNGSELVRGGGGPRCMSCPVTRDDIWS
ncbi:MAG TPA: arginine deiminase family protein [Gemmatimonadaceae bacterium]|jgi:arginine deiminase|nr:arginine deiminase family protein [Gemmatimonadaceae bacterium]